MTDQTYSKTKARMIRVINGISTIIKNTYDSYIGLSETEIRSKPRVLRISITGKCEVTREIHLRLLEEALKRQNFIIIPLDVQTEKALCEFMPLSRKVITILHEKTNSRYIRWLIRYIFFRRFISRNFTRMMIIIFTIVLIYDTYAFNWDHYTNIFKRFFIYSVSISSIFLLSKNYSDEIWKLLSFFVRSSHERSMMNQVHHLNAKSIMHGQPIAFIYRNLMDVNDAEEFHKWQTRINAQHKNQILVITSFDKTILKNKFINPTNPVEPPPIDVICRRISDIEILAGYQADITTDYDYMHKLLPKISKQLSTEHVKIISREKILKIINQTLKNWHVFQYSYDDINHVIFNVQLSTYVFSLTTEQIKVMVLRYLFIIALPGLENSETLLREYINVHFDKDAQENIYQAITDPEIVGKTFHHLHQLS